MKPVVTAAEMAAADAAALEHETIEQLIARAGAALAAEAKEMLGGTYGRRVVVVAGKGHNGDDGRVAAAILARRGVRVTVVDAGSPPAVLPDADLVIDAAFGTGFRGTYDAPAVRPGTAVLAVDIPSGLDADRGTASPGAVRASTTITFQAIKPGLILGDGPAHTGSLVVADIAIAVGVPHAHLIEDRDIDALLPSRPRDSHKWKSAVFVCAGSPGMHGAAILSASAAMRAGSGMVRLGVPGGVGGRTIPLELVEATLPAEGFDAAVLAGIDRCRALVVGPGIGRTASVATSIHHILDGAAIPVVLDADGLVALGSHADAAAILRRRPGPTVLTPHDGEYERLVGEPPGPDRVGAVRALAASTGAVVLLKGATTVVADPSGAVLLAAAGTPALATAGTGDVLSGVIAAFLARGLPPLEAAALAAHVHGRAGAAGGVEGLVAGDLPLQIAAVLNRARA